MNTSSEHETALVTGASGGLGYEFAAILAAQGYDLVLVARNEKKLKAIRDELEKTYGIRVFVCPADLSEKDAAEEVFGFTKQNGLNVDVLINNAGVGDSGSFAESDWGRQYRMVQLNVSALMQMTHCFIGSMIERGNGKILNISSVAAFCAGPCMSIYYASKAFVRSFSEAVSEEVEGSGVTVTCFCPGPTSTGFEKAASMKNGARMFRHAADAHEVAEAGIHAMQKGKTLAYCGAFTRIAGFGSRFLPRSWTRKMAAGMNR